MFPMREIRCDPYKNKPARFLDYLALGIYPNIQEHRKHWCERIGDIGLWCWEQLPVECWNLANTPKVLAIGITIIANLGITLAFYLNHTYSLYDRAIEFIPELPSWALYFSLYILLIGTTTSLGLRAWGRFDELDP